MAENIENLEFLEIIEIPITENKEGFHAIGHDNNGDAKKYPLGNLVTEDEVDGKLKDKADLKDLKSTQSDITTLKTSKADRAELTPINAELESVKTELGLAKTDITALGKNKVDRSELANLQVAIKRYKNAVSNVSDLPTTGNEEGDGRIVNNDKDAQGNSYIWVWDGTSWSRTPYTKFPGDIVSTKELESKFPLYFSSLVKYGMASDVNNGATSANVNYDNVQFPISDECIISNCTPTHILFYSGVPSASTFISYVNIIKDSNGDYTFTKPDNCTYISINFSKAQNIAGYSSASLGGGKRALDGSDRKFLLSLINKYDNTGYSFAQKVKLDTSVNHNNGDYPNVSTSYDNLIVEAGKYIGLKGCIPTSACYYKGEPKAANTLYCRTKFTQDKLGIYVLESPANATHISINFSKANNPNGHDKGLLVTNDDATTYQEIGKLIESLPNPLKVGSKI